MTSITDGASSEVRTARCSFVPRYLVTRITKYKNLVRFYQWRIQDFPQGGAPTTKSAIIFQIFAENCMKMKEFGPPGGGRASLAPPLRSANVYGSNSSYLHL